MSASVAEEDETSADDGAGEATVASCCAMCSALILFRSAADAFAEFQFNFISAQRARLSGVSRIALSCAGEREREEGAAIGGARGGCDGTSEDEEDEEGESLMTTVGASVARG